MEKETYDFMSDARSTFNGLFERARCGGDCIGGKKVLVTIAADLPEYKIFARTEGDANEVAAMIAVYIKKLNLQEKVKSGLEFIEQNGGISQLLLDD